MKSFKNYMSENATIDKFRDMVNKKTPERLIIIGPKNGVIVSLRDASNMISLYDNQTPAKKKEMEREFLKIGGLQGIIDEINESFDGNVSGYLGEAVEGSNIQKMVNEIKSKHGFEGVLSKSTLGGEDNPTFFIKFVGPKSTWTNNIAENSPIFVMLRIHGDVVDMTRSTYQAKQAGIKPFRKAKFKDMEDLSRKVKKYFDTNADKFASLLPKNESLEEASAYQINHKTYSSAVQHATAQAKKRGFEVDDEDYDRKVALGPKKPSSGKTNSFNIDLLKNGKPQKKKLHMQIYNADNAFYELNMYIESTEMNESAQNSPAVKELRSKGYTVYVSKTNDGQTTVYEIEKGDAEVTVLEDKPNDFYILNKWGGGYKAAAKFKSLADAVKKL